MRKFLSYILILIVVVGIFSPVAKVQAADTDPGICVATDYGERPALVVFNGPSIRKDCTNLKTGNIRVVFTPDDKTGTIIPGLVCTGINTPIGCDPTATAPAPANQSAFVNNLETCMVSLKDGLFNVQGCVKNFFYYVFYQVPAFLLWLCAYFFNVLISVSLSSTLFTDPFVRTAWAVVRDLSNIFFILILLYIAIKLILGLGGHDVKKMIVQVIIVALLINFSMFFTGIVIDTSNILALIFYNKLDVCVDRNKTTNECRPYDSVTGEKDVAGAMVLAFDPTSRLDEDFFTKTKEQWKDGKIVKTETQVPVGTMIGLILIAGLVMGVAAYALFISGLSFVGRLIELWSLIIFSPFAFMSSSVPHLSGLEYLGWKAWFSRLIKTAFMAPVFMFFLYFIFLLIQSNLFSRVIKPGAVGTIDAAAVIKTLLGIMLPTALIIILLLQATKFAKKGSGMAGEMALKLGGLATGVALGAASGGTALALRGVVGAGGGALANKSASLANRIGATKYGGALGFNKLASGLTSVGARAQSSSFDIRAGGGLAKITGLKVGQAQKGGIAQSRKEKVEKRKKRANILKVRDDETISKNIRKAEVDLQILLNQVAGDFHAIDEELKDLRQEKQDATSEHDKQEITNKIKTLTDAKKAVKEGRSVTLMPGVLGASARTVNAPTIGGQTIKQLTHTKEDLKIKKEAESRRRTVAYANRQGNEEARYAIIMESKIDSSHDEKPAKAPAAPKPKPAAAAPAPSGGGGGGGGGHH